MKKIIFFLLMTFLSSQFAWSQLITNKERRADIERSLDSLISIYPDKNLEKMVSDQKLSKLTPILSVSSMDDSQALQFLYAYMPLSDLADCSFDLFRGIVRKTMMSRHEMTWGKKIPEDIFLHFVLPPRVNNENIDSFRIKYYEEIKNRVKGLSMKEAALEINHWCHEKVTYRPSDERTISPMNAIKCSFGRCGEESTLLVSALRTAGIPARQVYVPRWTHCDDNHAWVEVWVDGKWHFMGACEPTPDLDMGWFAGPATRAMLVHTRVYGKYFGSEPVLNNEDKFAELDLIANYAPSKKFYVKVLDALNNPVENSSVEYQIYNYAEFYPLAKTHSDKNGLTSFTSGLGNLLVWATDGNRFGYQLIAVADADTVTIKIKENNITQDNEKFDFIAPPPRNITTASASNQQLNDVRLKTEDSIRSVYMTTFKDSTWSVAFAKKLNIDEKKTIKIFTLCEGNWKEIQNFLETVPTHDLGIALKLLEVISEKDLRDTKSYILLDHFNNSFKLKESFNSLPFDFFVENVMNGRIANEMMTDWRGFLQSQFDDDFVSKAINDNAVILNWIRENIKVDNIGNLHSRAPLTPWGVYNLRRGDQKSVNIFYVALCRSIGVPSRLNPETSASQFWDGKKWINVNLEDRQLINNKKSYIHLLNKSEKIIPRYATHFSLCIFKDGDYHQLDMEFDKKVTEFPDSIEVDAGRYMLVSGTRRDDGSVLSSVTFFEAKENQLVTVPVQLRENKIEKTILQTVNTKEYSIKTYNTNEQKKLSDLINDKGSVVVFLDPDREPTKHVMNDLPAYSDIFDKWGGSFIFVMPSGSTVNTVIYKGIPKNSIFVVDENDKLLNAFDNNSQSHDFPIVMIVDRDGNVTYKSEGYKIGTGERLSEQIFINSK